MAAELPPDLQAADWGGFADLVREIVRLEKRALARKQRLLEATAREALRYRAEDVEPTPELLRAVAARDVYFQRLLELQQRLVDIRRVALVDFLAAEGVRIRSPRDLEKWLRSAGPQAAFLGVVARVAADAAVRKIAKLRRVTDEEVVIRIYQEVRAALDKSYGFLLDSAHDDPDLAVLARECFSEFEDALLVFSEDRRLQHWPLLRFAQALLAVLLDEEELAFAKALVRHQFQQRVDSLDEMNWKSVAEEMGSTADALRMRWKRLKHRLAEVLSIVLGEMLRLLPQSSPEVQRRLLQLAEHLYGPGVLRPKGRSRSKRDQSPSESSLSSPPRHLH
jgi:hypothetical protein